MGAKKAAQKGSTFAVIWMVIWNEIRKAWKSFWFKSCDFGCNFGAKTLAFDNCSKSNYLDDLGGHLEKYTYGLDLFSIKKECFE